MKTRDKILLILIPPIILYLIFYGNPFIKREVIEIPQQKDGQEKIIIETRTLNGKFPAYYAGRFIQESLNLYQYNVCFNNQNDVLINNERAEFPGPDMGAIEFYIYKNTSEEPLHKKYVRKGELGCITIDENLQSFSTGMSYHVEAFIPMPDNFTGLIDVSTDTSKSSFYIEEDILTKIIKFITILYLWCASVLLFRDIHKFISNE